MAKVTNVERGEIRTMLLPVKLKTEEVMVRAKELAGKQQERTQAQERLDHVIQSAKGAKEDIGAEIEQLDADQRRLAEAVRSEYEDRQVEVYDEIDYKAGAVNTKRADTNHIVGTRGVTDSERQRGLFKDTKEGHKTAETGA